MADAAPRGGSIALPAGPPASWREALAQSTRALTFRRLRLAAAIFLGAHAVDFLVYDLPSPPVHVELARAADVALTLAVLGAALHRPLERFADALAAALVLGMGAFLVVSIDRNAFRDLDVADLALLLLGSALLFPFSGRAMAALAGAVLAMYAAAAVAAFGVGHDAITDGAVYLGIVGGTTVLGARGSSRARAEQVRLAHVVEAERDRADRLLANALPRAIVERLKSGERTIADGIGEASVLFADIVGFTPLSARLPPHELVDILHALFARFDELTDRHGVEKIKTIGDAYMAAAGVPTARHDHAAALVELALDLRDLVEAHRTPHGDRLRVRIGIHSGPLVAGVIGHRKLAYDLWGDVVNTAARMESHGEPGRVHVSAATAALLGDRFRLEPRGTVEIKGKGAMSTSFVERAG